MLVYRDVAIQQLSEEKGVVPEVDPYLFSIVVHPKHVTFVVGAEGSEGDRIVQDLRRIVLLIR